MRNDLKQTKKWNWQRCERRLAVEFCNVKNERQIAQPVEYCEFEIWELEIGPSHQAMYFAWKQRDLFIRPGAVQLTNCCLCSDTHSGGLMSLFERTWVQNAVHVRLMWWRRSHARSLEYRACRQSIFCMCFAPKRAVTGFFGISKIRFLCRFVDCMRVRTIVLEFRGNTVCWTVKFHSWTPQFDKLLLSSVLRKPVRELCFPPACRLFGPPP